MMQFHKKYILENRKLLWLGHVQKEAREKAQARLLRVIKRKKEGGSCGELDSIDVAGNLEEENMA